MKTLWIAYLLIFFADRPPVVMAAKHEPFETQQLCNAWVEDTEGHTQEMLAKAIDEGAPILSHKSMCIVPEEDGKRS